MSLCISRKMPLLEPRTSLDVLLPSPLLTQVGIPKKLEVFSNYLSKKKKKSLNFSHLEIVSYIPNHTQPFTAKKSTGGSVRKGARRRLASGELQQRHKGSGLSYKLMSILHEL